jgi:hypothetical protein
MQPAIHHQCTFQNQSVLPLLGSGVAIMNFERIQGGSVDCINTSQSKYFQIGYMNMIKPTPFAFHAHHKIADPFARNCTLGTHTNDIDTSTQAQSHMDALEWLQSLPSGEFSYVIFDPPFSSRQAEKYESGHVNVYTDPGYVKKCFDEIFRILVYHGNVLKLGYNSSRPNGFDLKRGWIVNFGGNRNDVIMTILVKTQSSLRDFK